MSKIAVYGAKGHNKFTEDCDGFTDYDLNRNATAFHINAKCFHGSTKRLTFRKEVFKEMAAKFSRFTGRVDAILAKQGGKSVNLLLLKKVGGLQKNAAGGVR